MYCFLDLGCQFWEQPSWHQTHSWDIALGFGHVGGQFNRGALGCEWHQALFSYTGHDFNLHWRDPSYTGRNPVLKDFFFFLLLLHESSL